MSIDLLSLLHLGANAMTAQNAGVATATNNVANANTPGYSREQVQLSALGGSPMLGGVLAGNPQRYADSLLQGRIVGSAGSLASSSASVGSLTDLQSRLTSGAQISDQLAAMYASLSQVAATPTDKDVRGGAVAAIQAVVTSVTGAAQNVADARSEADQQIRDGATAVTKLAAQLAAANKALASGSNDPTALDQRDTAAKGLAQLVGGSALIDGNGQMRYVLDGGAVLVDGKTAASLTATPNATTGLADLTVVDGNASRDVTTQLGGGSLGAQLTFRDQTTVAVAGQLDQIAYDLANSFNATSAAHAGLDGVAGRNMFVAPTQVAGAASKLALDPGLAGNSDELATAAAGAGPGDNTGALALFGLGSAKLTAGGTRTLGDAALDVIGGVAEQTAKATSDQTTDQAVSDNLDTLRDSLAGVDTQEETTNLAKFENVAGALTKFVSTINDMLTQLIQQL